MARRVLSTLAVLSVVSGVASGAALAGRNCTPGTVEVLARAGPVVYAIEVADEPEEQARGLMFRQSLPRDAGMLFVFDPPRPAFFWMRNTMISLDMIFIDDTGRVTNVAERTIPFSEFTERSEAPVRAVLEVNAGEAERWGIGPGTLVRHPAFRAAEDEARCAE